VIVKKAEGSKAMTAGLVLFHARSWGFWKRIIFGKKKGGPGRAWFVAGAALAGNGYLSR
jgi:hypothetical protein